jgi:hypothetical protein
MKRSTFIGTLFGLWGVQSAPSVPPIRATPVAGPGQQVLRTSVLRTSGNTAHIFTTSMVSYDSLGNHGSTNHFGN